VVLAALVVALAVGVIVVLRSRAEVDTRVRKLADGFGQNGHGELASSLDLNEVLDRTIDAAIGLPDVDAALLVVGSSADQVTASAGLSEDELARTMLQMPPHPDLRAVEVVYRYRLDDVGESSKLPRAALSVSLRADGEAIGSLAAISRSSPTALPETTAEALDALARRAGPAIANARSFAEAREQAELDSLTGLRNRRLFYDHLSREIARAQRYEHTVSVVVFDLDDFKRINDRIGHLGGDAVLAEVAERIRAVVRSTDIACRVGGDEFAVILPESSREDAELLAERIAYAIRSQTIGKVGGLDITTGVAELRPEDTATELFTRADEAMYGGKPASRTRSAER
jgi:diguanylate cyclase (GGDEF)-like protein